MRHAKQQTQTNGPSLKTAFVLWVLALCGAFLVLPYVATLENEALAAAAARTHLDVRELLAISVAQTVVLLAIAVVVGQWAARKLGLGTPLIAALLIVAAMLFGLGHLPATGALAPLSAALVVRAIVLSGTGGLLFGELYRRYGL